MCTIPFRSENFKRHLRSGYPTAWMEFDALASEEKEAFFAADVNLESTLLAHHEGWNWCKGQFFELGQFANGLASMFPNTETVEAESSLISGKKTV